MSDETNTEPTSAESASTPPSNAPTAEPPSNAPSNTPRKPEFGELAPEGWVNPITGEPATPPAPSAPAETGTPAAHLAGVPHNLGKGVSRKSDGTATVATPPAAPSAPTAPASATDSSAIPSANIRIDRIATILLLAAGAIGSLNMADSFMQLPALFAQLYALFELGAFIAPAWFAIVSTIGWVSQLLVWALTLLLSVQRIRRQKIAFFVPLAGAALAAIIAFVLMAITLTGSPELLTYLSTNGFSLEQLQELQ